MKNLLMALVLTFSSFVLMGCACGSNGDTLVETWPERSQRIYRQQIQIQSRELNDDWDYLWLQERNSQLTQWHPYEGY